MVTHLKNGFPDSIFCIHKARHLAHLALIHPTPKPPLTGHRLKRAAGKKKPSPDINRGASETSFNPTKNIKPGKYSAGIRPNIFRASNSVPILAVCPKSQADFFFTCFFLFDLFRKWPPPGEMAGESACGGSAPGTGQRGDLNLTQALPKHYKQDASDSPSAGQNPPAGGKAGLPERPFPLTQPAEPTSERLLSSSFNKVPLRVGVPGEKGGLEERTGGGEGSRSLPTLLIPCGGSGGKCRPAMI